MSVSTDWLTGMDLLPEQRIVIYPEDLPEERQDQPVVIDGQAMLVDVDDRETDLIVIRTEDLPPIPYIGPAPVELIEIIVPPDELRVLERHMLDLINADRMAHPEESGNAKPLDWDDSVAVVARAHSEDMIAQGFMDHVNLAGQAPADRLKQAGIWFLACGENIAGSPMMHRSRGDDTVIYTGYPSLEQAEDGLMTSPGHRRNILFREFTHVGVGIARNRDGTFVITQNFVGRPAIMDKVYRWYHRDESTSDQHDIHISVNG